MHSTNAGKRYLPNLIKSLENSQKIDNCNKKDGITGGITARTAKLLKDKEKLKFLIDKEKVLESVSNAIIKELSGEDNSIESEILPSKVEQVLKTLMYNNPDVKKNQNIERSLLLANPKDRTELIRIFRELLSTNVNRNSTSWYDFKSSIASTWQDAESKEKSIAKLRNLAQALKLDEFRVDAKSVETVLYQPSGTEIVFRVPNSYQKSASKLTQKEQEDAKKIQDTKSVLTNHQFVIDNAIVEQISLPPFTEDLSDNGKVSFTKVKLDLNRYHKNKFSINLVLGGETYPIFIPVPEDVDQIDIKPESKYKKQFIDMNDILIIGLTSSNPSKTIDEVYAFLKLAIGQNIQSKVTDCIWADLVKGNEEVGQLSDKSIYIKPVTITLDLDRDNISYTNAIFTPVAVTNEKISAVGNLLVDIEVGVVFTLVPVVKKKRSTVDNLPANIEVGVAKPKYFDESFKVTTIKVKNQGSNGQAQIFTLNTLLIEKNILIGKLRRSKSKANDNAIINSIRVLDRSIAGLITATNQYGFRLNVERQRLCDSYDISKPKAEKKNFQEKIQEIDENISQIEQLFIFSGRLPNTFDIAEGNDKRRGLVAQSSNLARL